MLLVLSVSALTCAMGMFLPILHIFTINKSLVAVLPGQSRRHMLRSIHSYLHKRVAFFDISFVQVFVRTR